MQVNGSYSFFLGSNSGGGFRSFFSSFYDAGSMRRVYLLKGGPGNGKSTLMKKIAAAAIRQGITVETVHCPSDPSSLDGVLLRESAVAVVDATPPHAQEAQLHGALERYVSLSPFVSDYSPAERREAERLTEAIRRSRTTAEKQLTAACAAATARTGLVLPGVATERLNRRGRALAEHYLPKHTGRPQSQPYKRFLSAITPAGVTAFPGSVASLIRSYGKEPYIITVPDEFGLSPFLLSPVLEAALSAGCVTYACWSPLMPSRLTGVIVPEAGFAVIADGEWEAAEPAARQVHLTGAIAPDVLRAGRARLRLLKKAEKGLVDEAVRSLDEALKLHDELESIGRTHTDFAAIDRLTDDLIRECCDMRQKIN